MDKNLKDVFQNTQEWPENDLVSRVWENIIIRNKRITYIKIGGFSLLGTLSLLGIFPAFIALSNGLSKSGFYEYFSLLFSSNGELASYWKELSFSLAESLPVIEIIYALLLVFVLFLSLRYVAKQIIKNKLTIAESSILSI